MKSTRYALLMLLLFSALSGCNTTRGIGQDLEAAGGAIENAAEETEEELED